MKSMFIPKYISEYLKCNTPDQATFDKIKQLYKQNLLKGEPDVTISIPAYNEEDNIIPTLLSLCSNKTSKNVEILVVNNNSKDRTEEFVKACGVKCILESKQGITNARNGGLAVATGKFVMNADADTIYPVNWIEDMIKPLDESNDVAITYGIFSLIPIANTGRMVYYFYEMISELSRFYNKHIKTEAVNVYGFNSAFRREQALQVEGFDHLPGTNEDGYLALKLTKKGFGKMFRVNTAVVWTTDRRIQIDGGLFKASVKRIKRVLNIK